MANFMIEFKVLAMKADTNELDAIFFTQKECLSRYYQNNIGLSIHSNIRDAERIEGGNYLS